MSSPHSRLQRTLVGLLSPGGRTRSSGAAVIGSDWDALLVMIAQHRLGPLLHWRLSNRSDWQWVPKSVEAVVANDFRAHTVRSLELRRQVIGVQRVLSERGIAGVFLKGAFLAFHAYPHPALRPLRDLDVLVPREHGVAAFEILLGEGFTRAGYSHGDPIATLSCLKHFPALVSASGKVIVELHTRLIEPPAHAQSARGEPTDDPAVWERLIHAGAGAERVAYLSPTDQLLHLIIHAVFDHHLDNGLLTLPDIAYLLEKTDIDWPGFWRMSAAGGWLRGCWLLLRVVDRVYAPIRMEGPDFIYLPEPPDELMSAVVALMLGDRDHVQDVRFGANLMRAESFGARLKLLFGRVCPPRQWLAATGAPAERNWPVAAAYLAHWWRLASVRVPEYLFSRRSHGFSREAAVLALLKSWLAE